MTCLQIMQNMFFHLEASTIKEIELGSSQDLAHTLFIKYHSILPSVPDVATAIKLFLTLPVTVASAKSSFTKLKLIKTYLRSSMAQERLSGLLVTKNKHYAV